MRKRDTAAPPTAASGPRRILAALLAALLLWAAPLAPGGGAAAQGLDYRALLGLDDPPEPPQMSRPAEAPERPADLAAYGELGDRQPEASMVRRTAEGVGAFRERLERMLRDAEGGPDRIANRLAAASPDGQAGYFAGVALVTVILILIGRAVVTLFAVYVFRPVMISAQRAMPPVGVSGRLPILALRMALTVAAIVINLAVTLGLGIWLVESHAPTQATAGVILAGYVGYVLIDTAWRMVISPYLSAYRIPRMGDNAARRLYIWLSATTFFGVASWAALTWLSEMRVDRQLVRLGFIACGFVALLLILGVIWRNRAGITTAILHGRPLDEATWIAALGARAWAPLVSLYFVAAWLDETFRNIMGHERLLPQLTGGFLTLMVALIVQAIGLYVTERIFDRRRRLEAARDASRLADAEETAAGTPPRPGPPPEAQAPPAPAAAVPEAGGPLLRAAAPAPAEAGTPAAARADGDDGDGDGDGDGDEEGGARVAPPPAEGAPPAPPRRGMRSYEDLARRVSSLFALGAAGYLLILIWGGAGAFADGAPLDSLQDVIDILLIGYVAYHAVRIWLDNKIAEEGVDDVMAEPGDEGGGASAVSRLGTLLPLFRSAILAVIGVSVLLVVASKLGINVAPLFAGAGIVGIAIGFGAQTLVRDILSGMFFLLDDAFRKGEYIDVGEVKGTVEKISLRSFQLRHHLGALNTIPFGEIKHLTNYSRDWVMMKLPLRLTYDTDVEKVRKLIKKLGQELLEHETEGKKFVQPLKSQGVYMMEDSAMIFRVKYMTRPGDQWTTRKLVYQRIREIFEKEGIRFAHKEVTVRMPDLDKAGDLSEEERRAVGAAARRAVDDAEEAGPGGPAISAAEAR